MVLFAENLDQLVESDNEVRLIDAFVESLDLAEFNFNIKTTAEGRPAYHPSDLLKLYMYGYINGIRSSRQLERECTRNTEMMWLLKRLKPDHNTISNFRRDNADAVKKVFQQTVRVAKNFNLIGKSLVAGDSTKLRAQNSRKSNFNSKKIQQHLEYINQKIDEYNGQLEQADTDEEEQIRGNIKKHKGQKVKYEALQRQLEESGQAQISTSDSQSRLMTSSNNPPEVVYNIQATVDAKHCLPIDYEVTNENDKKAMGAMVKRAEEILETNEFTALFDKGYYTGSQLKEAQQTGATVIADIPAPSSTAPDPQYNLEHFTYDESADTYTCPQGQILTTTGTYYPRRTQEDYKAKQYRTKACQECLVKQSCTRSKTGKVIERSIYAPHFEQNARNIAAQPDLYKQRKCIVEHPFGTIKRQWGFHYILTKEGKKRASADVGFMFIAYNWRRLINIVGKRALMQYLGVLCSLFSLLLRSIKFLHTKIRHQSFVIHLEAQKFSKRLYALTPLKL